MRNYLIAVVFMFVSLPVIAQDSIQCIPSRFISGKFSYFKPDDLGNLFALTTNGQLKKYNTSFDSMGVFNDVRKYGRLHSISFGNALRTALYFKEYRTLLIVDRLMQVVNRIDLRKADAYQVSLAALGYDNNVWLFDEQESRIKKISEDGALLFQTADLRVVLGEAIRPNTLFDLGGYIYLYDPVRGLYIFDYYGALKKKIALLEWSAVQPLGKNIAGIKNGKLMVYAPESIDTREWILGKGLRNNRNIYFTPKSVMTLEDAGIRVYDWKNN